MITKEFQKVLDDFEFKPINDNFLDAVKCQTRSFLDKYRYDKYNIMNDCIYIYSNQEILTIIKAMGVSGMLKENEAYKVFGENNAYKGYFIFKGVEIDRSTITYHYEYNPQQETVETKIVFKEDKKYDKHK